MVMAQLLQHDWDAVNANLSIKNFKSIDLVCFDSKTKKHVLVQVKTTVEKSVTTGFDLGDANTANLEDKILGPWVFVFVTDNNGKQEFRYFVLSRSQVIKFINDTNQWYLDWTRKNPVNPKNPCCLDIRWFSTNDFNDGKHDILKSSFIEDPEDNWDNIWKD